MLIRRKNSLKYQDAYGLKAIPIPPGKKNQQAEAFNDMLHTLEVLGNQSVADFVDPTGELRKGVSDDNSEAEILGHLKFQEIFRKSLNAIARAQLALTSKPDQHEAQYYQFRCQQTDAVSKYYAGLFLHIQHTISAQACAMEARAAGLKQFDEKVNEASQQWLKSASDVFERYEKLWGSVSVNRGARRILIRPKSISRALAARAKISAEIKAVEANQGISDKSAQLAYLNQKKAKYDVFFELKEVLFDASAALAASPRNYQDSMTGFVGLKILGERFGSIPEDWLLSDLNRQSSLVKKLERFKSITALETTSLSQVSEGLASEISLGSKAAVDAQWDKYVVDDTMPRSEELSLFHQFVRKRYQKEDSVSEEIALQRARSLQYALTKIQKGYFKLAEHYANEVRKDEGGEEYLFSTKTKLLSYFVPPLLAELEEKNNDVEVMRKLQLFIGFFKEGADLFDILGVIDLEPKERQAVERLKSQSIDPAPYSRSELQSVVSELNSILSKGLIQETAKDIEEECALYNELTVSPKDSYAKGLLKQYLLQAQKDFYDSLGKYKAYIGANIFAGAEWERLHNEAKLAFGRFYFRAMEVERLGFKPTDLISNMFDGEFERIAKTLKLSQKDFPGSANQFHLSSENKEKEDFSIRSISDSIAAFSRQLDLIDDSTFAANSMPDMAHLYRVTFLMRDISSLPEKQKLDLETLREKVLNELEKQLLEVKQGRLVDYPVFDSLNKLSVLASQPVYDEAYNTYYRTNVLSGFSSLNIKTDLAKLVDYKGGKVPLILFFVHAISDQSRLNQFVGKLGFSLVNDSGKKEGCEAILAIKLLSDYVSSINGNAAVKDIPIDNQLMSLRYARASAEIFVSNKASLDLYDQSQLAPLISFVSGSVNTLKETLMSRKFDAKDSTKLIADSVGDILLLRKAISSLLAKSSKEQVTIHADLFGECDKRLKEFSLAAANKLLDYYESLGDGVAAESISGQTLIAQIEEFDFIDKASLAEIKERFVPQQILKNASRFKTREGDDERILARALKSAKQAMDGGAKKDVEPALDEPLDAKAPLELKDLSELLLVAGQFARNSAEHAACIELRSLFNFSEAERFQFFNISDEAVISFNQQWSEKEFVIVNDNNTKPFSIFERMFKHAKTLFPDDEPISAKGFMQEYAKRFTLGDYLLEDSRCENARKVFKTILPKSDFQRLYDRDIARLNEAGERILAFFSGEEGGSSLDPADALMLLMKDGGDVANSYIKLFQETFSQHEIQFDDQIYLELLTLLLEHEGNEKKLDAFYGYSADVIIAGIKNNHLIETHLYIADRLADMGFKQALIEGLKSELEGNHLLINKSFCQVAHCLDDDGLKIDLIRCLLHADFKNFQAGAHHFKSFDLVNELYLSLVSDGRVNFAEQVTDEILKLSNDLLAAQPARVSKLLEAFSESHYPFLSGFNARFISGNDFNKMRQGLSIDLQKQLSRDILKLYEQKADLGREDRLRVGASIAGLFDLALFDDRVNDASVLSVMREYLPSNAQKNDFQAAIKIGVQDWANKGLGIHALTDEQLNSAFIGLKEFSKLEGSNIETNVFSSLLYRKLTLMNSFDQLNEFDDLLEMTPNPQAVLRLLNESLSSSDDYCMLSINGQDRQCHLSSLFLCSDYAPHEYDQSVALNLLSDLVVAPELSSKLPDDIFYHPAILNVIKTISNKTALTNDVLSYQSLEELLHMGNLFCANAHVIAPQALSNYPFLEMQSLFQKLAQLNFPEDAPTHLQSLVADLNASLKDVNPLFSIVSNLTNDLKSKEFEGVGLAMVAQNINDFFSATKPDGIDPKQWSAKRNLAVVQMQNLLFSAVRKCIDQNWPDRLSILKSIIEQFPDTFDGLKDHEGKAEENKDKVKLLALCDTKFGQALLETDKLLFLLLETPILTLDVDNNELQLLSNEKDAGKSSYIGIVENLFLNLSDEKKSIFFEQLTAKMNTSKDPLKQDIYRRLRAIFAPNIPIHYQSSDQHQSALVQVFVARFLYGCIDAVEHNNEPMAQTALDILKNQLSTKGLGGSFKSTLAIEIDNMLADFRGEQILDLFAGKGLNLLSGIQKEQLAANKALMRVFDSPQSINPNLDNSQLLSAHPKMVAKLFAKLQAEFNELFSHNIFQNPDHLVRLYSLHARLVSFVPKDKPELALEFSDMAHRLRVGVQTALYYHYKSDADFVLDQSIQALCHDLLSGAGLDSSAYHETMDQLEKNYLVVLIGSENKSEFFRVAEKHLIRSLSENESNGRLSTDVFLIALSNASDEQFDKLIDNVFSHEKLSSDNIDHFVQTSFLALFDEPSLSIKKLRRFANVLNHAQEHGSQEAASIKVASNLILAGMQTAKAETYQFAVIDALAKQLGSIKPSRALIAALSQYCTNGVWRSYKGDDKAHALIMVHKLLTALKDNLPSDHARYLSSVFQRSIPSVVSILVQSKNRIPLLNLLAQNIPGFARFVKPSDLPGLNDKEVARLLPEIQPLFSQVSKNRTYENAKVILKKMVKEQELDQERFLKFYEQVSDREFHLRSSLAKISEELGQYITDGVGGWFSGHYKENVDAATILKGAVDKLLAKETVLIADILTLQHELYLKLYQGRYQYTEDGVRKTLKIMTPNETSLVGEIMEPGLAALYQDMLTEVCHDYENSQKVVAEKHKPVIPKVEKVAEPVESADAPSEAAIEPVVQDKALSKADRRLIEAVEARYQLIDQILNESKAIDIEVFAPTISSDMTTVFNTLVYKEQFDDLNQCIEQMPKMLAFIDLDELELASLDFVAQLKDEDVKQLLLDRLTGYAQVFQSCLASRSTSAADFDDFDYLLENSDINLEAYLQKQFLGNSALSEETKNLAKQVGFLARNLLPELRSRAAALKSQPSEQRVLNACIHNLYCDVVEDYLEPSAQNERAERVGLEVKPFEKLEMVDNEEKIHAQRGQRASVTQVNNLHTAKFPPDAGDNLAAQFASAPTDRANRSAKPGKAG